MKGFGTDEKALIRVLCDKDPLQIEAIKSAFNRAFKRNLIQDLKSETSRWFEMGLVQLARGPLQADVKGDLSMKTERHFMLVLAANRAEDSAPVDPRQVDEDVVQLYKATEGRMGTDEILVCSILTSRNNDQIRAIAHSYKQKFRKDLDDVIKSVSFHKTENIVQPETETNICKGILWSHERCTPSPAAVCC
jgi:annexin A7/11